MGLWVVQLFCCLLELVPDLVGTVIQADGGSCRISEFSYCVLSEELGIGK